MKSFTRSQVRKPVAGVRVPAEALSESVGFSRECPRSVPAPKLSARAGGRKGTPSRKDIRAEVFRRARGSCESCGAWVGEEGEQGHLDHFFGRAKVPEAVENCWGLCVACDHAKTNNRPAAAYWLARFALHATKYGYDAEAQLADSKLETLKAKGLVTR